MSKISELKEENGTRGRLLLTTYVFIFIVVFSFVAYDFKDDYFPELELTYVDCYDNEGNLIIDAVCIDDNSYSVAQTMAYFAITLILSLFLTFLIAMAMFFVSELFK